MNAGPRRPARSVLRVLAAGAMLLVAAAATVSAPTDDDVQTPIESVGPAGTLVVSRLIEARVEGLRVARRLVFPAGSAPRDSTTTGVWVVVDLTVSCRIAVCGFDGSELRLGSRSYATSAIAPGQSFASMAAGPLLRYRTSALFEVPRSALTASRARLAVQPSETRNLDGVPVITLRLPNRIEPSAPVLSTTLVGAAR